MAGPLLWLKAIWAAHCILFVLTCASWPRRFTIQHRRQRTYIIPPAARTTDANMSLSELTRNAFHSGVSAKKVGGPPTVYERGKVLMFTQWANLSKLLLANNGIHSAIEEVQTDISSKLSHVPSNLRRVLNLTMDRLSPGFVPSLSWGPYATRISQMCGKGGPLDPASICDDVSFRRPISRLAPHRHPRHAMQGGTRCALFHWAACSRIHHSIFRTSE